MSRAPNQCCILAVDTAARSGWALVLCGVRINSGEVSIDDDEALRGICNAAVRYTVVPSILVLERPWASGHASAYIGLGAARHAWLKAWKRANNTKTVRRCISVLPQTWRGALGIKGKVASQEMRLALCEAHRLSTTRPIGDDEFEALMIAAWGIYSPKVTALLPKRKR